MERSHKKRLKNNYEEDEEDEEEKARPKKVPKTLAQRDTQKRLIVVLERANLETVKVSYKYNQCICEIETFKRSNVPIYYEHIRTAQWYIRTEKRKNSICNLIIVLLYSSSSFSSFFSFSSSSSFIFFSLFSQLFLSGRTKL